MRIFKITRASLVYQVEDINADCLVRTIKDALLRMNVKLSECRGQCYDGASNMSGSRPLKSSKKRSVLSIHTVTDMH